MYLMPKIAGLLDAMLTRGGVRRYGGWLRFIPSAAIELVFSFLQGAVSTIRTSIFMIGLLFGKSVVWGGQSRDAQRLTWAEAAQNLWPQTLFGVIVCGALIAIAPAVFWWSLPLTAGYLLAIPFAVVTAEPPLGRLLQKLGICGIPEDFAPPAEVTAVMGNAAHGFRLQDIADGMPHRHTGKPLLTLLILFPRSHRSLARSTSTTATRRATRPWTRSTRAS